MIVRAALSQMPWMESKEPEAHALIDSNNM